MKDLDTVVRAVMSVRRMRRSRAWRSYAGIAEIATQAGYPACKETKVPVSSGLWPAGAPVPACIIARVGIEAAMTQ